MKPPVFETVKNDPAVIAAFWWAAKNQLKVYPFGRATEGVTDPYCVWRIVSGAPENYLGDRPVVDSFSVQFDVYGISAKSVEDGALALRDAIEGVCYITSWLGTDRDASTQRYTCRFIADWWTHRN